MAIPKEQSVDEESVTVIVSRKVKSGMEKKFEEWAEGITREVKNLMDILEQKIFSLHIQTILVL